MLTSQRITDVVLKAFTAAAASQVGTCLSQTANRCRCAHVGPGSVQETAMADCIPSLYMHVATHGLPAGVHE